MTVNSMATPQVFVNTVWSHVQSTDIDRLDKFNLNAALRCALRDNGEKKMKVTKSDRERLKNWKMQKNDLCLKVQEMAVIAFKKPAVAKHELEEIKAGLNTEFANPSDLKICNFMLEECQKLIVAREDAKIAKERAFCNSAVTDLTQVLQKNHLLEIGAVAIDPVPGEFIGECAKCCQLTTALKKYKKFNVNDWRYYLFGSPIFGIYAKKTGYGRIRGQSLRSVLKNLSGKSMEVVGLEKKQVEAKLKFALAINLLGSAPKEAQKTEALSLLKESRDLGGCSAANALKLPFVKKIEDSSIDITEQETKQVYFDLKASIKSEGLDKFMSMSDFDRAMEKRSPKETRKTFWKSVVKKTVGPFAVAVALIAIAAASVAAAIFAVVFGFFFFLAKARTHY